MTDSLLHLANVVEDFLVAGQEAKTFPSDGNSSLQLLIHKQTAEDFDQGWRILIRKSNSTYDQFVFTAEYSTDSGCGLTTPPASALSGVNPGNDTVRFHMVCFGDNPYPESDSEGKKHLFTFNVSIKRIIKKDYQQQYCTCIHVHLVHVHVHVHNICHVFYFDTKP